MDTLTYSGTGPRIVDKKFVQNPDGTFVFEYKVNKPKIYASPMANKAVNKPKRQESLMLPASELQARIITIQESVTMNNKRLQTHINSPCGLQVR